MTGDRIPIVGTYRGVELHDFQPRDRIENVVQPAIDAVFEITDPPALVAYAFDASHPPEARLFAAARAEASWQLSAEGRSIRPSIDLNYLRAVVAGLDSRRWMDPVVYGTMLDHGRPGRVERERPLNVSEIGR